MKKNKILLICTLVFGLPLVVSNAINNVKPIITRAEEETICDLTFPDDNKNDNKVSSYTKAWVAKKGNYEFEISNANNNNWNKWTYIKFGNKADTSIGTIQSKTLFSNSIEKIKLTIDTVTAKSINGIYVEVSEDQNFTTTAIKEKINIDKIEAGVKEFNISSPSNLNYYKITFDCKKASKNGTVQISNISFIGSSTPSSSYTVAFDSNEGTFNSPDKWKTITSEIGLETEITLPTKDEITTPYNGLLELIGWTDGEATYNPGEKLKVLESKTFKAVYKTNLTIAEALLIIEKTGDTATKIDFTVSGKITEIKEEYTTNYNNISVNISDGTNKLYVHRMQGGANLIIGDFITVTGSLINYQSNTPEFTTGSTFVMDSISAFNAVETKTNLKFNYNETIENNVNTYSDFSNVQIQYQYTFDTTKYTNAQEIGIYVTDDEKFDFDTTGIYDDNEFTFDKMKAETANSHKFINSNKKETYTVGINLGELNEDSVFTKFMACAYVKIDGKYYFAGKSSQYDMFDLLDAYSKKDDLDETSKKIVSAFNTYLEGFLL